MAHTIFTNGVTLTEAAWFNDIDTVAYTYFGDLTNLNTPTKVAVTIGAFSTSVLTPLIDSQTNPLNLRGTSTVVSWATTTSVTRGEGRKPIVANGFHYEVTDVSLTTSTWVTLTLYSTGTFAKPTAPNTFRYEATTGGTSDAGEPTWPTIRGRTVTDGTVIWTCRDTALTGGSEPIFPTTPGTTVDDVAIRWTCRTPGVGNLKTFIGEGIGYQVGANTGNFNGEYQINSLGSAPLSILSFADDGIKHSQITGSLSSGFQSYASKHTFYSFSDGTAQFAITNTANALFHITVTGSLTNPVLSTTGGSLSIDVPVLIQGSPPDTGRFVKQFYPSF
jgi:hypothetical protein